MIADAAKKNQSLESDHITKKTIDISPCTLATIQESGSLRTVVGCGVSVCLFDRRNRVAGMNHFLFPRIYDPQKATYHYGNAALIGLFRLVKQYDEKSGLIAYIAGGAYCDEFEMDSAIENIHMAWKFLLIKEIPIISQYVGGRCLREVTFNVLTGIFTAKNYMTDQSL
jgi:chemotaxis protein CheD